MGFFSSKDVQDYRGLVKIKEPTLLPTPSFDPNKINNEISLGEPYVFLEDFSFSRQGFGGGNPNDLYIGSKLITEIYKKGQVVYPFKSAPNERRMVDPAFTEAISKGILVKQNDSLKKITEAKIGDSSGSNITDKIFGRSKLGGGLVLQRFRVGIYIIAGAILGGYVAKSNKKSTLLGVVAGGVLPIAIYKLSLEYDRKNKPNQQPLQEVAINPDGSIMTEKQKQIQNTQISSDITKFISQNKPSPYMPQVNPLV